MRHLILLRHAKAVATSPDGDFARPLSPRGRLQASNMGLWLATQPFAPDALMASPALRTKATADLVREALAAKPARHDEMELYNAPAETILALARASDTNVASLLMVGHNPGMAELANILCGAGDPRARRAMAEKFPTCACAVLSFDVKTWRSMAPGGASLVAYATPKALGASKDDA